MDLTQATLGFEFKKAFYEAAKQLMASTPGTEHVYVVFGQPATYVPEDIIAFGRITAGQDAATLSTNRSREETLTLEVMLSCFQGGGEEAELVASERCYELLRLIERHVRMTDTTVGGTVRECFLTSHESDGATPEELLEQGRVIDVTATFTAKARVRA
ncbi:hypothetical protein V1638_04220 [Pseudarthrobacter sp. J64]|uniref:hypothetical protein n=1 Tax=Pseudarthrobacter sp. J64 TaxID=3116485 RepID=UPI002E814B91|nr:hypothetical protein [Pseudarthrobacter sp. J64]MEE2568602.1 hypothetical protein [Pseudarthrobacter sp. J64]